MRAKSLVKLADLVGNLFDPRFNNVSLLGVDRSRIPACCHLDHGGRGIKANDPGIWMLYGNHLQHRARPTADVYHTVPVADVEQLHRPCVIGEGFPRHDTGDQSTQKSARMAGLRGNEFRSAHLLVVLHYGRVVQPYSWPAISVWA